MAVITPPKIVSTAQDLIGFTHERIYEGFGLLPTNFLKLLASTGIQYAVEDKDRPAYRCRYDRCQQSRNDYLKYWLQGGPVPNSLSNRV